MKKTLLFFSLIAINAQSITPEQIELLTFRNIGPAVAGGRIHDVEVVPNSPEIVFIASASGGIWKSTSKGTMWKPVFDNQVVSNFGDIAISKSDPKVLYAGTGPDHHDIREAQAVRGTGKGGSRGGWCQGPSRRLGQYDWQEDQDAQEDAPRLHVDPRGRGGQRTDRLHQRQGWQSEEGGRSG